MKKRFFLINTIILITLFINTGAIAQSNFSISGQVIDPIVNKPIPATTLFIPNIDKGAIVDENGDFKLENLAPGFYSINLRSIGYIDTTYTFEIIDQSLSLDFYMYPSFTDLAAVQITDKRGMAPGIQRLRQVENNAIYASKKNELIQLARLTVNKATNNSRQVYAKVSGLNMISVQMLWGILKVIIPHQSKPLSELRW
jgi:Fe(3+) dicitrate transport protein